MIMELEQQVPSRELCEKLRDAGFPPETVFYRSRADDLHWNVSQGPDSSQYVAAPTVGEMREWLRQQKAEEFPKWRIDDCVFEYVNTWYFGKWKNNAIPLPESWWWIAGLSDADTHALTCLALLEAMKDRAE